MKIGIVDADLIGRKKHRFPNLVCEKLSGYWKARGAEVTLLMDYDHFDEYDTVYVSKVFTDKSLQLSTGNGIYVSNKLALTMGQVKVQTNTAVQRYLLFYCGLLVGIGSSKFSGISDYSASTYTG